MTAPGETLVTASRILSISGVVLEVQDELGAAGELDAVAAGGPVAIQARPPRMRSDREGDEVLRLAEEVEVRVLDDLHGRPSDAQVLDVALAEHPLEEELADEVGGEHVRRRGRSPG